MDNYCCALEQCFKKLKQQLVSLEIHTTTFEVALYRVA
jgi:hypothetical protein